MNKSDYLRRKGSKKEKKTKNTGYKEMMRKIDWDK
jgi:hypothetical protein